jgi:hypothetical protein
MVNKDLRNKNSIDDTVNWKESVYQWKRVRTYSKIP